MIIYKFSTLDRRGDALFEVSEIEVEEKPKVYVNHEKHLRIRKEDINVLDKRCGYKMFCLDFNPRPFLDAVIESKKKRIEALENTLEANKKSLKEWEKRRNS